MNLTTSTPVEIDTALADVYRRGYTANAEKEIRRAHRDEMLRGIERAEAGDLTYRSWTRDALAPLQAKFEAAVAAAHAVWAEATPFHAEFDRRGGWTRAFLVVTSGKGHIHRSMNCTTCYPTTEFAWLPEMSGSDETAIVTAAGADACTVCYPTAPVETAGPRTMFTAAEKATAADRAARDADRAAKAAAKAAKSITAADGTTLRDSHGCAIGTERTAEIEAVSERADQINGWTGCRTDESVATVERIVAALAAKRGTDIETQRAVVEAKAVKKAKRDAA